MANFGSLATGSLGGAASGATLGSFFPGVGTAVGAGLGGLLGLIGGASSGDRNNMFAGYEAKNQQVPTKSPQQIDIMNQLAQLGMQGIQKNQNGFNPIAQQARSNFAQQTIPGIAERFSALGAQNSSAFGQQLGAAGAGLNEGLAGLESQYNLGQQGLYQDLLGLGLGDQFQNQYHPAEAGLNQQLPGQLLANLPQLLSVLGKLGYIGSNANSGGQQALQGVK